MKTNYLLTDNLMRLLLLIGGLWLTVGNMWGSSYYAKLTASTVEGTGSGTVYVASPSTDATEAANDAGAHATSMDATSADSKSTDFYFTVYATAARGSMFSSWTTPTGKGNPAIYTDGGYSTTSNPVLVKVTSSDSDGTNEATILANFVANPVPPFDVYFLEPEGNGTYTVSSYIGYPEPVQGGDPVSSYNTDEIILTATNGEGYGFRRFYYVDAEDKKKTLGSFAQKEQLVTLSPEMKKIGCEFVAAWEANYVSATNGSYTAANGSTAITVDSDPSTTTTTYADDYIKLTATPNANYAFFRFVGTDALGNTYTIGTIGLGTQTVNIPQNTVSITAEFTDKPFIMGTNIYATLDDAIQATRQDNGSYKGIILLVNDYTIPAGYYTIPMGVTLLIPVDANQIVPRPTIERVNDQTKPTKAFKTLTLATETHLDVFGAIEVGGRQNCYNNNGQGRPQGTTYGVLDMKSGSTITLENGANLYAWGFVIGDRDAEDNYLCSIDVRRGACVHEQFQMYDWEGGSETVAMEGNDKRVFIINEYFIQNVEVSTTYRPGSALYTYTGILGNDVDKVKLIGVEGDNAAMFLMDDADDSEDTWVRKSYQPTADLQVYEINNAAKLGNLEVPFVYYGFTYVVNSRDYVLPITHNMKIHLLTGKMDITQNTVLLPGAEIEVDKQSTVVINDDMTLYLFDYHEWDAHIHQGKYAWRAECRPGGISTVRDISSPEGLGNAKLNIHGTFIADGLLITTEGGAEISSNNDDAGTIIFKDVVPETTPSDKELYVHNYKTKDTQRYYTRPTVPAKLLNGDGTYATTAGTPAGQSYCYMNGKWTMMTVDEDNSCFVYDNYGNYYAKPGEYVMINATKTDGVFSGNADHTYSDAEGTGRLFILVDGCQWWEVVNEDNLYHCTHEQNNTYYWWNNERMVDGKLNPGWEEKKFAISWKDYDGSPILDAQDNPAVYYLPYGATPKYLSTNPTRPADVDYTYNFTGWSPAFAPIAGDQTYTATYSKTQIKYTIIFKFVDDVNDGAEIERQQLARDEMPTIPTLTPRDGWYLKWTPAVAAVTGNATYVADWMEELPDNYTVTWKNYDGTTLKTTTPARDASAATVLSGAPASPEKPATAEYRYEFTGWQPAVTSATADASYVAQYREVAQTYSIRFYQEDGTTQIDTTQSLVLGADPVVPNYSKSNTAQYTFRLQWKNMDTDVIVGVSVPSVSDSANYQAVIDTTINRYTITAVSEDENGVAIAGCTFTGAGTYDYGTNITLTAIPNEGYEFVKWQDTASNELATTATMRVAVTANRTYTAVVRSAAMEVGPNESKTFSRPTTITDLVINASEDESSDLNGLENLTVTRDAYFIYSFKATRFNRQTQNWYAFGVPFEVDAEKGISANGRQLELGRDIDIVYYDGQTRADNGADNSAWTYVEDQSSKVLQPGVLYLAAFAADYDKVQFLKQREADLNNATAAKVHTYASANSGDANWNGIANPALYRAYLNAGTLDGQIYRSIDGSWQPAHLSQDTFTIGRPVFVQVQKPQSVVVSRPAASSAPLRRQAVAATSDRFDLQLLTPQDKTADRIFVIANEDAADAYTIGEDIAKAGVSTRVAQMWIDRYGARLCKNTIAATDNAALYPLTLTAPAAGSYTLQATAQSGDARLYLTYMGEVVADLTANGYTLDLVKGTNSGYGLRLVTTRRDVVTDLDEVLGPNSTSDNEAGTEQTQKCIYRNQLYLIRGGQVYDAQGQRVQ